MVVLKDALMDTKSCSRCKLTQPLNNFGRVIKSKDGLNAACKSCLKAYQDKYRQLHSDRSKSYYHANREEIRAKSRAYKAANPEAVIQYQQKYRRDRWATYLLKSAGESSKRRSHPEPDIDLEWVYTQLDLQQGKCYWTGITLELTNGSKDLRQVSLDRIDSSIGYTPGNVVLACLGVNLMRSTASLADTHSFLSAIRRNQPLTF